MNKIEKDWNKFATFVNTKIDRPNTGISLIHSSDFYREGKQERDILESLDPNTVQYGRSLWLSSLRSNEKVDKWPYNLSHRGAKKKRPGTNITKRHNYQEGIHSFCGTQYAYTVKPMRQNMKEIVRKSDAFNFTKFSIEKTK